MMYKWSKHSYSKWREIITKQDWHLQEQTSEAVSPCLASREQFVIKWAAIDLGTPSMALLQVTYMTFHLG